MRRKKAFTSSVYPITMCLPLILLIKKTDYRFNTEFAVLDKLIVKAFDIQCVASEEDAGVILLLEVFFSDGFFGTENVGGNAGV